MYLDNHFNCKLLKVSIVYLFDPYIVKRLQLPQNKLKYQVKQSFYILPVGQASKVSYILLLTSAKLLVLKN